MNDRSCKLLAITAKPSKSMDMVSGQHSIHIGHDAPL
jgi:hypothetical protein